MCCSVHHIGRGYPEFYLRLGVWQKPIVTTDVTGCREVVDDGVNGYLVPVKDSRALASAMEMIINLTDRERLRMGKLGSTKDYQMSLITQIVISKIYGGYR